jgi:hypothetical protein
MVDVGLKQHGISNFGSDGQALSITRRKYGATPAIDMMSPPISPGADESGQAPLSRERIKRRPAAFNPRVLPRVFAGRRADP